MATGVSGIPNLPDIPALQNFAGTVLHSSQYDDGEAWKGKKRARHRHRQQRPRHRAGPVLERRQGHPRAAQLDPDRQHRAERAAGLRAVRRRPPLEDCDLITTSMPLAAGEEEPHPPDRASAGPGQGAARRARARRLQARFRRGRHRLAVQVPHPRRRLLLQRRLLRSDRRGRDRAGAVLRHRRRSSPRARGCATARRSPPT